MDCSGEARFDEKLTEGSSMAPHIPFEVITEILAKLPVKSLLKFRVVCKSWCSLISTKQFVRKHLSSNNTSIPKRIIQLSDYVLTLYSLHDTELVQESSPIWFRFKKSNSPCCIMGYCDGLVLVKAYTFMSSRIFLWNPSTRDSKLLPYGPVVNFGYVYCYGFGYDYSSDDYKVLIVVLEKLKQFSGYKSMMYTLRTNSWRMIQDFPLDTRVVTVDGSATLVNGALHWMTRQGPNKSWVIISLDLTTETYMEVPQPDFCGSHHVEHIEIGASSTGCLCLNVSNTASPKGYDLWVMKEYGEPESWTMVDAVCVVGLRPMTLWFPENMGKILFFRDRGRNTYNANESSLRYLLPRNKLFFSCFHGAVYVESLVSLNAYSNRGANEISQHNIIVGRLKREVKNIM